MLNPQGSAASCGIEKGSIIKSPISNFSYDLKNFWFESEILSFCLGIASHVFSFAYTGMLYLEETIPKLWTWSECSWVTIMALISLRDISLEDKAEVSFFKLTPLSTNIFVLSLSINKLFPVLPLYKLLKFNILISSFAYSETLSILAPKFLNLSSMCS